MKLEKQVVSLEIAQRLAALGVEQESYFVWYGGFVLLSKEVGEAGFAAFTVPELVELLGENFGVLDRMPDGRFGAYIHNGIGVDATALTPADALGLLLEARMKRE